MLRLKINKKDAKISYEELPVTFAGSLRDIRLSEDGEEILIGTNVSVNVLHNPTLHLIREDGDIYFHDERKILSFETGETANQVAIESALEKEVHIENFERRPVAKKYKSAQTQLLFITLSESHNNLKNRKDIEIKEIKNVEESEETTTFNTGDRKRCSGDYVLYNHFLYQVQTVSNGKYVFTNLNAKNSTQRLTIFSDKFDGGQISINCTVPIDSFGRDIENVLLYNAGGTIEEVLSAGTYEKILLEDNRFFDKASNTNGENEVFFQRRDGAKFYLRNGDFRISVPIGKDFATDLFEEDTFETFANDRMEKSINKIIDYEKVMFVPCYEDTEGELKLYNTIKYNIHLRTRTDFETWVAKDNAYWFYYPKFEGGELVPLEYSVQDGSSAPPDDSDYDYSDDPNQGDDGYSYDGEWGIRFANTEQLYTINSNGGTRYFSVTAPGTWKVVGQIKKDGTFSNIGTANSIGFRLTPYYGEGDNGSIKMEIGANKKPEKRTIRIVLYKGTTETEIKGSISLIQEAYSNEGSKGGSEFEPRIDAAVDFEETPFTAPRKINKDDPPILILDDNLDGTEGAVSVVNTPIQTDIISSLGMDDDDIYYQKNKVKNTFLRLSFYNTNDRRTQQLLYTAKLYLDSSRLFGRYLENAQNYKNERMVDDWSLGDKALSVDFTCSNRLNGEYTSEGFYLYLFPSNLKDGDEGIIYMKAEFSNAKYGHTIPLVLPRWTDGSIIEPVGEESKFFTTADHKKFKSKFPIHYLNVKKETKGNKVLIKSMEPNMDRLNNDTFIPIKIFKRDGKYYWSFNIDIPDNEDDISLAFFEPRINGTETIAEWS